MKKIEAIIKPFKLEEVKEALAELGVEGMTVTEVKGLAGKRATRRFIAAANTRWIFCPRSRWKSCWRTAGSTAAVDAIVKAAKTGKIGDGKVFVSPIENAIRIRTEETGEKAV